MAQKRSQITQPPTRSRLATSTTSSWRERGHAGAGIGEAKKKRIIHLDWTCDAGSRRSASLPRRIPGRAGACPGACPVQQPLKKEDSEGGYRSIRLTVGAFHPPTRCLAPKLFRNSSKPNDALRSLPLEPPRRLAEALLAEYGHQACPWSRPSTGHA